MHLQRNATQRNAYHNYILNNNFKFYIFQFFRTLEFLSGFSRFAKIYSFIKESKSSYFFEWQKSKQKTISFFVKKRNKKTTPFRLRNSVFMGLLQFIENQFAIFNYAFSCASNFEIISQSDYGFCYKNYFFNLNQVFRNSYDFGRDFDFGRNLNYGFGKDYNRNFKKNCDYDFEKNYNFGFGKNYFGNCNFGYGFGMKFVALEIIWRAFYLIEKF